MKPLLDNTTGHIVVAVNGKKMLVDTGAAETFYGEYQGVRVDDLSRMIGVPLDGVMGMDSLQGRVVSISRNAINLDDVSPCSSGIPLDYVSATPCVHIHINGMPCTAAVKTGATTTYLAEELLSRDRYTRTVNDSHPLCGTFQVEKYINYFSISDKCFFADAGEVPAAFSLLSSTGVDAIIGTDLLRRFNLILDFAEDRFHLVSR